MATLDEEIRAYIRSPENIQKSTLEQNNRHCLLDSHCFLYNIFTCRSRSWENSYLYVDVYMLFLSTKIWLTLYLG